MTHILTLETLIAKGACSEAQKAFAQIFPNGAPVAIETFVNVAGDFDWRCAMKLLLRDGTYEDKWTALNDTQRPARAALRAKYGTERDTLNDKHRPARRAALHTKHAPEWAALIAKQDAERDALDEKHHPEWNTLDAERATLFATLYIEQLEQDPTP